MTIINAIESFILNECEYSTPVIELTYEQHNTITVNVHDTEADEKYILTFKPYTNDDGLKGYECYQYNIRTQHSNYVGDIEL